MALIMTAIVFASCENLNPICDTEKSHEITIRASLPDSPTDTKSEIAEIVAQTKALEEYQEAEDSKEDMAKIPLLSREDIGKEARKLINKECAVKGIPALVHDVFTNGIAYLRMIFEIKDMPQELLCCTNVLRKTAGNLSFPCISVIQVSQT